MSVLTDRTLLVTGVSSGIGLAVARRLLAEGSSVVGVARRAGELTLGEHYLPLPLDLAETEMLPERLIETSRRFPTIDGLVLCAGLGDFGSLEEFSPQRIRRLVEVNLVSNLYLCHHFVPRFKQRRQGDIVVIGSEAALQGGRYGAVYSATKFALRGLVQSLRHECAPRSVRVTLINPGLTATPFYTGLHFEPGGEEGQHLTAEDVADVVLWVLQAGEHCLVDEINLSPRVHVVRKKGGSGNRT